MQPASAQKKITFQPKDCLQPGQNAISKSHPSHFQMTASFAFEIKSESSKRYILLVSFLSTSKKNQICQFF